MKIVPLVGLLILLTALVTSCKTYKNLEKVKPKTESASMAEQLQKLNSGDRIKVYEKNGSVRILTYVHTESGILIGIDTKKSKERISIRVDDIAQVQVRKTDVGSTAISTGLAITIGALAFVFGLLIYLGSQSS
ncbi:hypothetical protein MMU07_21575 [Aquiflexum sp. LQ15W]|uniref:hypothetical protein n=1 Tax=Cognataquiflexum nitidum TaxID=2922272 RepID=UPI001F129386|nr:hypothetical protein [Cognataquiflexum nitidum]MCH6202182.1 hypothetical protein [Cognataquiflexum nitidum]